MDHPIMLGGQPIGWVQLRKEGLYYHFDCRCSLTGEVVYRIQAQCGDKTESLGIPVPCNGAFELRTNLPVKRLGEGEITFRAVPKHVQTDGIFVPLSPEEPFRYLRRLQDAFLQVRDGKVGVVIPRDRSCGSSATAQ